MAADANVVISHITTSGVVVFLINWLKKSSLFPWITAEQKNLLRVLALAGAAVGAVGIHYTWNPVQHSLLIEGLSLMGILTAAIAWLKSFVTQEIIYQATKQPVLADLVNAVIAALKSEYATSASAVTVPIPTAAYQGIDAGKLPGASPEKP
jgi:hydrogenase-4 membrane subunit HyfE